MRIDHCQSCGAPIYWARHERTGRSAPIDAAPDVAGTIELMPRFGGSATWRVIPQAERVYVTAPLYTPHYATCPQAAAWRKRPLRGERGQRGREERQREATP